MAGARAIFEPLGNILSAKSVGVKKPFCDLFGFDRSDLSPPSKCRLK
jgi:hypothetical protein